MENSKNTNALISEIIVDNAIFSSVETELVDMVKQIIGEDLFTVLSNNVGRLNSVIADNKFGNLYSYVERHLPN